MNTYPCDFHSAHFRDGETLTTLECDALGLQKNDRVYAVGSGQGGVLHLAVGQNREVLSLHAYQVRLILYNFGFIRCYFSDSQNTPINLMQTLIVNIAITSMFYATISQCWCFVCLFHRQKLLVQNNSNI